MVLNKDPCCLLVIILASYKPCVAHIKVYFTFSSSSVEKPHLKWQKTCFLSTWLEDGFKGKVLLYNVWKFYTRSFSHWRATTLSIMKTGYSQYLSIGYKTGFRIFSHNYFFQSVISSNKGVSLQYSLYYVRSATAVKAEVKDQLWDISSNKGLRTILLTGQQTSTSQFLIPQLNIFKMNLSIQKCTK